MDQKQTDISPGLAHLVDGSVSAGFPSPAEDYTDQPLDLNEFLIKRPHATFFVWAAGNSMVEAGIRDRDLLIVDRSLTPVNQDVVIAAVDGSLTVKTYETSRQGVFLRPAGGAFPVIPLTDNINAEIWGVVTYVIHQTRATLRPR